MKIKLLYTRYILKQVPNEGVEHANQVEIEIEIEIEMETPPRKPIEILKRKKLVAHIRTRSKRVRLRHW